MAWVLWKGMKEEVEADGDVPCSLLQVCWLTRKHAVVKGLSLGWGNAAFTVTLVFGAELWLGETCFLHYIWFPKVVCK